MQEHNVKIFRMKDNIDVIAKYEEINGFEIKLIDPLIIGIEMREKEPVMMLLAWLPAVLLKKNEVILKINDLIMLEPTDDVIEFYISACNKHSIIEDEEYTEDMDNENIDSNKRILH